jgi:PAS domain S-box-containing protein
MLINILIDSSLLSTIIPLVDVTPLPITESWSQLDLNLTVLIVLVFYGIFTLVQNIPNKDKFNWQSQIFSNLIPSNTVSSLILLWVGIALWGMGYSHFQHLKIKTGLNLNDWVLLAIAITFLSNIYLQLNQSEPHYTQALLMSIPKGYPLSSSSSIATLTHPITSEAKHSHSGAEKPSQVSSSVDLSHLILSSINQMSDPMLWVANSGKLLYGNQSACHFFGYDSAELESLTIHDITLDFPASMWSLHWRTLQQCGSLKIETRCRTKHQRPLAVEMTINHLQIPGQKECQCIIIRDISDHKQIERALRLRQGELRTLVNNIQGAVYRSTFETKRTMAFISDGIEAMIQCSARDLIHNRCCCFNSLIHPIDRSLVTQQIKTAIQTRKPYSIEYRLQRQDGSWRWVYDQGQGVFDSSGKLLWLSGAIFDITENKKALGALRASEERLQLALSGSHQGLWDWYIRANEFYLSPQWLLQLGYSIDDIDSQPKTWLKLVHPADRHHLIQNIRQHLLGNTRLCHVEYRMLSQCGEWHWILNRSKVVCRDRQGRALRMIGTVQDISDRKLAEVRERAKTQQLEQTLLQLKETQTQLIQSEKLSSLGQMVAGLAHEINNPVTFISGNISFAQQYLDDLLHLIQLYQQHHPQPHPEIFDWMDEIELEFLMDDLPKLFTSMEVGASRIKDIICSLRNFSRLDEAEMKQVDIHEGIDNTLLILQHRLYNFSAKVEIQVIKEYGQLPEVECYAGQLNQVFLNLLSNAIDAILDYQKTTGYNAQVEPTILIQTAMIKSDWIKIEIIDNGTGMTEEVQQHLFEPFFTTKPVGTGTGLGLATSYQIIKKHGGNLTCESVVGQGAKFIIEIPQKTAIDLNLEKAS